MKRLVVISALAITVANACVYYDAPALKNGPIYEIKDSPAVNTDGFRKDNNYISSTYSLKEFALLLQRESRNFTADEADGYSEFLKGIFD